MIQDLIMRGKATQGLESMNTNLKTTHLVGVLGQKEKRSSLKTAKSGLELILYQTR
jgi:hypothetical protein